MHRKYSKLLLFVTRNIEINIITTNWNVKQIVAGYHVLAAMQKSTDADFGKIFAFSYNLQVSYLLLRHTTASFTCDVFVLMPVCLFVCLFVCLCCCVTCNRFVGRHCLVV